MRQSSSSVGATTDRYSPGAGPGCPFALIWPSIVLACLTRELVKLASLVTRASKPVVTHRRADGRGGYG